MVVFVDDLQWAGRTPLGLFDLVLSEEPVEGLLLVGAYREGDVDAAHPLAALLSRWRDQAGVRHLRLDNLPVPASVAHGRGDAARGPGRGGGSGRGDRAAHAGQPVRDRGAAQRAAPRRRADRDGRRVAVGRRGRARHLGRSEVGRAAGGAGRGPAAAVRGRWSRRWPAWAGGSSWACCRPPPAQPAAVVEQAAGARPGRGPAGGGARGASGGAVPPRPPPRGASCAGWTRSGGAPCSWRWRGGWPRVPELFAVAAEQYLPVVDAVDDAAERRQVVRLLRRAADQATLIGDHALVNALLAAALRLIDPGETATLVEVRTGRHAALYSLGRLEEADEEYRTIDQLVPAPRWSARTRRRCRCAA